MSHTSTASTSTDASAPLRWSEKIGYASGDFASCLYFGVFMNFLNIFYTDVFGISAAAVGTMVFITRTWDWINDPMMGMICDRTKTRLGKFRPWLLWAVGPYAVLGVLTFTTFDLSDTGKLVYAYITYTLLTMAYTAINIPYSALMGVMTARSEDRTTLASYRFIGAFAGTMVVNATLLWLVQHLGGGDQQRGYSLTMCVYALMATGFFLLTFATTKERVQPPPTQKVSLGKDLLALCRNVPWLVMILVSVCTIMWIAIRGGATIHYFKYASGNENWGSLFLAVSSGVQIAGVIFTKHLVKLFRGKKATYISLNLLSAVLIVAFYYIPPTSLGLIITHQVIISLVSAPLMPLFWSMIADTADYGQWKLGQRSTGLLFSAGTASQKIGWSIGPAVAMWLLAYFGFQANVTPSAETVNGLQLIMSWIPAGFAVLAAAAVLLYPISSKMEKEMEAAIIDEEKRIAREQAAQG